MIPVLFKKQLRKPALKAFAWDNIVFLVDRYSTGKGPHGRP